MSGPQTEKAKSRMSSNSTLLGLAGVCALLDALVLLDHYLRVACTVQMADTT